MFLSYLGPYVGERHTICSNCLKDQKAENYGYDEFLHSSNIEKLAIKAL
jgi:hypothetical protein